MMVSVLVFQMFERLETSHFQRSRGNEGFPPLGTIKINNLA